MAKDYSQLPNLLAQLWFYLSRIRHLQFVGILFLMLVNATTEIISLGALFPFLVVLTTPEKLFNINFIKQLAYSVGILEPAEFVLPLVIIFTVAAIIAAAMRIILMWASIKYGLACGENMSVDLYRRTLYQPYEVHQSRNSSEIIVGITSRVNDVIFGVLQPSLTLISSVILLVVVVAALIAMNPMMAIMVTGIFGISYGFIALLVRRRLRLNSSIISKSQTQVMQALQEGLGGIREVLLDGSQHLYTQIYQQADTPLRKAQGSNQVISALPRQLMEVLGIALIATLAYTLSGGHENLSTILPTLGVLALGAQRLLPTLQQAYAAWSSIVLSEPSLKSTLELLDQPLPFDVNLPPPQPLAWNKSIKLKFINFSYALENKLVLDGLNIEIKKGARVGFIGPTGAGKSTAVNILLGLLKPVQGEFMVDDAAIQGGKIRSWQRTIAHVPQSIYLSDATIAENIAFGIPRHQIDLDGVKRAAIQASIDDFIASRPEGYSTIIGENGVRLSGGQRQRIGIARALYKSATVLVLDEATSALDNHTEASIMRSIKGLNNDLTIIMIAHRLSTIKDCDLIFEFSAGKVVAQGTYEELMKSSPSFRSTAGIESG